MNDRYFACTNCRAYVFAGDPRGCYWRLESLGIVRLGEPVDADRVLGHESYWNPPRDRNSVWLYDEVFPAVREFIHRHRGHHLVYWQDNHLPDDVHLHWLRVGWLPYPSPRYFAEVLGYTRWDEVLAWEAAQGPTDDYYLRWPDDERREAFRQAFEGYSKASRRRV